MASQFPSSCSIRKLPISRTGFFFILFLFSCSTEISNKNQPDEEATLTKFSQLLSIRNHENVWTVTIQNPWQNTADTKLEYRFSEDRSQSNCIPIPVKKVVCFSSSHVAMISVLGKQKAIAGISGLQFICDTTIKSMAEEGLIWEAGYEDNINFELFLKEKPDVALIYGVGTEHARYVARLEKLGIHVIYIAEYLEDHPLGRLEWIRLFGILFNNYQKADSIFLAKSESYHSSCIRISDSSRRPVIFSGSPIGDNWYVPGGNSYMANLINDAGGLYILHQNKTNESYPISFENAYRHILTSDIWINCDIPGTVVYGQNSRYLNTPPVINRKVFSNTARTGNGNGNDFWESGVVNPEIILKDLIYIIQPESIKNHQHVYYQKM